MLDGMENEPPAEHSCRAGQTLADDFEWLAG
jgi:hypothetical protein